MNVPIEHFLHFTQTVLFAAYGYIVLDRTCENDLKYGFIRDITRINGVEQGLEADRFANRGQ